MINCKKTYICIALLILSIYMWVERYPILDCLQPRPSAASSEFSRTSSEINPKGTIISADEKINITVFEKVNPAVVNIATTTLSMNFWLEVIPKEGQGSGFIIDKKGYILTNNHVVAKAQKITVTMADGRKIPATLIGRDPPSDLAVIKIPSKHIDIVAPLGDSDTIRVGQKAIAIGNPFGLSHTLTTGIISALNRGIKTQDDTHMENLIQTDAAINPGNSGGPLLNSNGEVIGINTAILSLSGGYQGVGFAIPINRAKHISTQLINIGRVVRPWLGITGISVTPGLSEGLGLAVDRGVLVVKTFSGSPAAKAGLRGGNREIIVGGLRLLLGGDIIMDIDGNQIPDMNELGRVLDKLKVGQTVALRISRNGRALELKVLLTERP